MPAMILMKYSESGFNLMLGKNVIQVGYEIDCIRFLRRGEMYDVF